MRPFLASLTSSIVLLALCAATPASAATIAFTGNLMGGDVTTSLPLGPNDPVTGFVNVPFNALTVSGSPINSGLYTPLFLQENFNPITNVLTLTGTINGCGLCGNLPGLLVSTDLVVIQFASGLTLNTTLGSPVGSLSSLNMPLPGQILSITVAPALLTDLGVNGQSFVLTGLTFHGHADSSTGGNYVSDDASLVLSTSLTVQAVPEPGTCLLVATGLGLIGRRRARRTGSS